ncbi:hypothetical protein Sste5346_003162 [Sporothrix stenoceras]|uniref:Letm1 RBD domain-containing protein n=1 Tax=Sporothrix stenoceras TaxID=5173 RepID=A0ABR3ZI77_9PEZI
MTPTTQLCAARATIFSPIANGRTIATAISSSKQQQPLGFSFMRSIVAAYSSSFHSSARPLSTRLTTTKPLLMTASHIRTRYTPPSTAFVGPLIAVRPASSSSSASTSSSTSHSDNSAVAVTASSLTPSAANPPHTTRPPPLVLPERKPDASTFSHLLATGKAYLAFYKTGLRYLFANTKLVRAMDANNDTADAVKAGHATRSDLLLRRRWGHDMRRLPLFGLLLLICGEFTPFVVLVFPHVVPYPCRIPKQVEKLRRDVENRRSEAFKTYGQTVAVSNDAHAETATNLLVSRSLGLVAPFWDRIGLLSAAPGLATRAVERRLAYLTEDDTLLRQAGGVPALEPDEVFLASADRGLDVLGQDEGHLREELVRWLQLTRPRSSDGDNSQVHDQMLTLLSRRPEAWPSK